jgi:hypothetical protein
MSASWSLLPGFGPDCAILNFVEYDCRCPCGFLPFVLVVGLLKAAALRRQDIEQFSGYYQSDSSLFNKIRKVLKGNYLILLFL